MKILFIILMSVTCVLASYTVENKSITVGYTGGNAAERAALEMTIRALGFMPYESMTGTTSDFVMHRCQVVFNFHGSGNVTGWLAQMNMYGRGYIQCSNTGWQFFCAQRFTLDENTPVNAYFIRKKTELTTFPNVIPGGWDNTHGLASYSDSCHDYLANCTESCLPILGSTAPSESNCTVDCPRALTVKDASLGRGVFYGWCNYGDKMTSDDRRLTENAIIYAAQPPHADAGGPYIAPVGEIVVFDAKNSFDNTAIVLYEWDFDDDGVIDFASTSPIAKRTWGAAHEGIVILRCTDTIGGASISRADVTIGPATPIKQNVQGMTLGSIKAEFH